MVILSASYQFLQFTDHCALRDRIQIDWQRQPTVSLNLSLKSTFVIMFLFTFKNKMSDQNLLKLFALLKGQILSYYKLPWNSAMPLYLHLLRFRSQTHDIYFLPYSCFLHLETRCLVMWLCRMLDNKASSILAPKRRPDLCSNSAQKKHYMKPSMCLFDCFLSEHFCHGCDAPTQCDSKQNKNQFIQPHCLCQLLHSHLLLPNQFLLLCSLPYHTVNWNCPGMTIKGSWGRRHVSYTQLANMC